jgi:hypothetical protein
MIAASSSNRARAASSRSSTDQSEREALKRRALRSVTPRGLSSLEPNWRETAGAWRSGVARTIAGFLVLEATEVAAVCGRSAGTPNETFSTGANCASGQIFFSEDRHMANSVRPWTSEDLEKLKAMAGNHRREEIAAELNRGVSSVAVKAHQLSISLPKRRPSTAASAPGHRLDCLRTCVALLERMSATVRRHRARAALAACRSSLWRR